MLHIHFCASKANGTGPPRNSAKAHGEQVIVAFYNGMATSVDKGKATDAIYFCKAFDLGPQKKTYLKTGEEWI